ncbi:cold shock protein 2-like [Rutidosis leptorrhynchoides]|uniref:cold shock protein 2-like n=1 Tax=Rutidosis leptorrhynchoides TaxID=125765 RepID=UPI003A99EFD0
MAEAASIGVVIRFHDSNKGFGFIKSDEGGDELFVHQSEIQSDGYRTLQEGQKVKFLVVDKNDKQQAVNVTALDGSKIERSRNRDGNRDGGYNGRRSGGGDGYRYRNSGGGGGGYRCFTCGEFGHLARKCRRGGHRSGGGGGGSYPSGGGGKCYMCGEPEHTA